MEPREKAIELVDKFQKQIFFEITDERLDIEEAKGCALIAVDEILKSFGTLTNGNVFYTTFNAIEYYQEVRQEINNL